MSGSSSSSEVLLISGSVVGERGEPLALHFCGFQLQLLVGVSGNVLRIGMRLCQRGNLETKSQGDTPAWPRIVAAVRLLPAQYRK